MCKVVGAMVVFWLLLTFGGVITIPMFKVIVGGGIEQEFLYPIYFGIIVLAGLIVGCTIIIYEKLNEIENINVYIIDELIQMKNIIYINKKLVK